MVNNHANTVVFSLIASTPMIHVIPSRGNKIMVLFREDLNKRTTENNELSLEIHSHKADVMLCSTSHVNCHNTLIQLCTVCTEH